MDWLVFGLIVLVMGFHFGYKCAKAVQADEEEKKRKCAADAVK